MTPETPSKSIALYYSAGASDKIYQAAVEPKGTGFVVNFAFDLLEQEGTDLRKQPYHRRLTSLGRMLEPGAKGSIRLVETANSTVAKRALLDRLRTQQKEGVVFKRRDAQYTPGRPSSGGDQLKLKFTTTASCIVAKVNGTKRSVALELLDGGKRVAVGNVTIPPSMAIPKVGSIVETRYLYAFPGGSLYQPVCLGVRDGLGPEACTITQLKHKNEEESEG
jgi:bifunctional non-homologous end joining protein LigD